MDLWTIGFSVAAFLVGCFGLVVFVGAPYVPTLQQQVTTALELLALKPGQTLIELGSGDGKVLLAAAQRGLVVVGYELNPLLVLVSRIRLWRYRKQVRVVWGNFWAANWPPTDGIFCFNLQKYMQKLDTKIMREVDKPVRLASFAFTMKRKANTEKDGIYLYVYDK